jgi:hypothetical protein
MPAASRRWNSLFTRSQSSRTVIDDANRSRQSGYQTWFGEGPELSVLRNLESTRLTRRRKGSGIFAEATCDHGIDGFFKGFQTNRMAKNSLPID